MATSRTLNFLPEIFQTDTNKKFLAATLDQLVSEPAFTRVDGYIGRTFAPGFAPGDTYINEIDTDRTNYQFEPSIVIKNSAGDIEQYSSYTDLINKIQYYNGLTNNHDRLFSSESYTYDGQFDFDKFINYSQYYWLPNGLEPVLVTSAIVSSQKTFTLTKNINTNNFTVNSEINNPTLVLVRGGLYKFNINQPGFKVWIQTEPGSAGTSAVRTAISTRNILGINNNGQDVGQIEFRVPLMDAQDNFLSMPIISSIDYATNLSKTQVLGKRFHNLIDTLGGFDGSIINPDGKTILFLNDGLAQIWRVTLTTQSGDNDIIALELVNNIQENCKVYVRSGLTNRANEYYNKPNVGLVQVPPLTAHIDKLYYQDSYIPGAYGTIELVNDAIDSIYVDNEIIGQSNFTSPNGVVFTNGLVVKFDGTVQPATYANKIYIVEGVGNSISLVAFANLVSPEPNLSISQVPFDKTPFANGTYDENYIGPIVPDYIVSNRASIDLNAWARQNRWFHIDVIEATAAYNQTVVTFDQALRAQRPIIEFESSIQLFNNGRIGKRPIDIIDFTLIDAFSNITTRTVDFINQALIYTLNFTPESDDIVTVTSNNIKVSETDYNIVSNVLTLITPPAGFDIRVEAKKSRDAVQHSRSLTVSGVEFKPGHRVLFAADKDPLVRTQVYTIQYSLQAESATPSYYDGTGLGQITIEPATINFGSVADPYLITGTTYGWRVIGNKDILTAVEVTGIDYAVGGTVVQIDELPNRNYLIHFTTPNVLDNIENSDLQLVGPGGSNFVFGGNTKFETDVKVGGALYTQTGDYIGTVAFIISDTKLRLEAKSYLTQLLQEYKYRDPRIQLVVSADPDDVMTEFDSVVSLGGAFQGIAFWYNGTSWVRAQQKTAINQPPKFDIIDIDGQSYASSIHASSKFSGTRIFSYSVGTGSNDLVLGFPLTYKNFNSLADIVFDNNFDNDTFEYLLNGKLLSKNINTGYLRKNSSRYNFTKRTAWNTQVELDKQYQVINAIYTGTGNGSYFEIDILPNPDTYVPNLKVFLNNTLLNPTEYQVLTVGAKHAVHVTKAMAVGDSINILVYSSSTSTIGFYQVPQNLDFNSKNLPLTNLTLGQLRNHVSVVGQNSLGLAGQVPGNSNLRDISIKNRGGNILQSAAPTIYASLFLISKQANFINSINYARKEYTKFKNKFLETALNLSGLDYNDPSTSVDTVLKFINQAKNTSFPWNRSDMVPYGNYTSLQYTVIDPSKRQYKINSIFDITQLQTRAVLIYNGSQQLVHGKDYYFPLDRMAVIINELVYLIPGSIIEIREYNTEGNYIPETPTKLGLYPKFLPGIVTNNTYRDTIQVIQGHDGSLTPIFGDYRDLFLLELETRIYNNIKVNYEKTAFDLRDHIPGRFRTTDYSISEFNSIKSSSFMTWAGENRVNFNTNNYFVAGDPFTYNYKSSTDTVFNESLPGWWRGIYNYFYDTDRPHSHPWEMLGFTEQPTWWVDTYGHAPYTSENVLLWKDLSLGIIQQGTRAGTYEKYARAKLSKVIPVDEHGNLIPPLGIIAKQFNGNRTAESFAAGDQAPAESAWMRSSDYPYALQQIVAVMKPAMYFAMLFDTTVYKKNASINQYQMSSTGRRQTPGDITIHGETVNGTTTNSAGYINYIGDYLISQGIDGPNTIRSLLTNLNVQLCYKVGGFTDKNYITVLAEQYSPGSINESIIVPDQNYKIYLNKSVPVDRVVYSAVIIERTETGYSVNGYDKKSPYFVVIPSNTDSENYSITVQNISATIYKNYQFVKLAIPYGHEFTSRQQVVDFLVSYQRYLNAQGFIFDEYNQDMALTQDWVLSAREFLTWTLQGWSVGSVMILSPCNSKLTLISTFSVVDEITNDYAGSKILDPNFLVIKNDNLFIIREAENFVIKTINNQTIAFAELDLVQHEHVLIFDNITIFNDVIYSPELGNRQYRLRLLGSKTADWNGSLYAPGFIYNSTTIDSWVPGIDYHKGDIVVYKNTYYTAIQDLAATDSFILSNWKIINKSDVKTGLLSNFATNAKKFNGIYDVDGSELDEQLQEFGAGLIGFRKRNYLSDLNLTVSSQIKFYQGFIKDKGTKNAINALKNTSFMNLQNDVTFYEEWGFRVGEYGAQNINQTVEIQLDEAWQYTGDLGITIINDRDSPVEGMISIRDKDLYARPLRAGPVRFINRDNQSPRGNDIQTAGYVNLNDVDSTVFDSSNYNTTFTDLSIFSSGYTIWVAKGINKDWDVYRVTETNNIITTISYSPDLRGKVTTKHPHEFIVGDTIIIKQLNNSFNGFYEISSIDDRTSFTVTVTSDQNKLLKTNPVTGTGIVFLLKSVRFESPKQIVDATPLHTWKDSDLVWVDSDETGRWAVYEKGSPWKYESTLGIKNNNYRPGEYYGAAVKISPNGTMIVVGSPGEYNGVGGIHLFKNDATKKEISVLPLSNDNIFAAGFCVDLTDQHIIVGAPNSKLRSGKVIVYSIFDNVYARPIQVIDNPSNILGTKFGYSISASSNGEYLYVSSPGTNQVHLYQLQHCDFKTNQFNVSIGIHSNSIPYTRSYQLPYSVTDHKSIAVYFKNQLLTLTTDYTIVGNFVVINTSVFSEVYPGLEAIEFIVITSRSYYDLIYSLSAPEEGVQFGYSVKTQDNGNALVVGAPDSTVAGKIYAGAAYIYKKYSDNNTQSLALIEKLVADVPTYHGKFGSSVDISNNAISIYVGAPGYSSAGYSGGAVFRFVNNGLFHGTIKALPVTGGIGPGSFKINNTLINFSGGTINELANKINQYNILGVTAKIVNSSLIIDSAITTNFNKLEIIPTYGQFLEQIGISIYQLTQRITKPLVSPWEKFGGSIVISNDDTTVLISSINGSVNLYASLDNSTTTFDGKITRFLDYLAKTGVVYAYELFPASAADQDPNGMFGMTQEFGVAELSEGDIFGSGIDFNTNTVIIGAQYHDSGADAGENSGQVYYYSNIHGTKGWTKTKQQLPSVEVTGINRVFLYNAKTKSILTTLDYIDPAKGKILGIADQELDFKSSWDPAGYNSGTGPDHTNSDDYHWNSAQLGVTWWNLDNTRYIDYEQQDLNYRFKNWGKTVLGSDIAIYEWIASTVLPSKYSATETGTPLYPNDSAYVTTYGVDPTGIIIVSYYYWVRGRIDVPVQSKRILSAVGIEQAILNPKLTNIPYAEILSDCSIGLVNCQGFISGKNTILQIDYDSVLNSNVMHNEFELVQQGNANSKFPDRIVNKLVDSLSGIDCLGSTVPDHKIRPSQQLGIGLRPRQTMVLDKSLAIKNMTEYVNSIFAKTTAATKIQSNHSHLLASWFNKDPEPAATEYNYRAADVTELGYVDKYNSVGEIITGLRVLVAQDQDYYNFWTIRELTSNGEYKVVKNQQYNTTRLWDFTTWYSSEYTTSTKINYVVNQYSDIEKLNIQSGNVVKVLNHAPKGYEIYKFSSAIDSTLIALENGTLKLKDLIWDTRINGVGFDNAAFDASEYDGNYSHEIRNILIGLQKDIFIEELSINYNELLFVAIQYILSEQKSIDWVFKTSFIDVLHKIRELQQYPIYIKDNTTYYRQYLEEVKPYRTKIRNYRIAYTGIDMAAAHTSDFDLPGYYDADLMRFRSPSTEYYSKDNNLFLLPEYQDWKNNYLNGVGSIQVLNRGQGYTEAPRVTVVDSAGTGTGVVAYATINELLGAVISITVVNPGKNFRGQPSVVISGNGSGATAVAKLSNNKIRSIKTLLKFDRIAYATDILEWMPNLSYALGQRLSHQGRGYIATLDVPASQLFNFSLFKIIPDSEYTSAIDRIAAMYRPNKYQIPRELYSLTGEIDFSRLVPTSDNQVDNTSLVYNDSMVLSPANYDDISGNKIMDIALTGGTFFEEKISRAPEELIPGLMRDALVMTVITNVGPNANVAYRMFKSIDNKVEYHAISSTNTGVLTFNLFSTDTTATVDNVSLVTAGSTSSSVFINGEKITYRGVDIENKQLLNLSRGVGGTPVPNVHVVSSRVEYSGANVAIPGLYEEFVTNYVFKKTKPSFTTTFAVPVELATAKNQLDVYIGITVLPVDVYYTVDIVVTNAVITMTPEAIARLPNGTQLTVRYREYAQWQDYNTTLANSVNPIAVFLKSIPYY